MSDPDDDLGQQIMEKSVKSLLTGKEDDNRKDHVLRFKESGANYSLVFGQKYPKYLIVRDYN